VSTLPDFEAWAIFAKIAETGSFARAAGELGLSKATISKAVTRLEHRLGTTLLHRTSRRLSLSESGRASLERALRLLEDGEAIEASATAQSSNPRGLVRMAAPMSFGVAHLAPLLPEFLALYPEVSVELSLSDALVDLVRDGFDLALRISDLEDSSLRARRLCPIAMHLVGAPAYFERHGRPQHPRDLVNHPLLTYTNAKTPGAWRFRHPVEGDYGISVQGRLRVNNADAMLPSLRAGLGIAILPDFLVSADLVAGHLVTVMADWVMEGLSVHLLTPPSKLRPIRVEALMRFVAARFAKAPWALSGSTER
jgi:DNA-binding transcriptional LysR family regulator